MPLFEEIQNGMAEVELIYKSKVPPSKRAKISSPEDAYRLLIRVWDENKIELLEQFKVIYLNQAKHVLAIYNLSTGGLTSTVVDPRFVVLVGLKLNARSIILSHNHPSGNLEPSRADKLLTEKLENACNFFDIELDDHMIVSKENFSSFAVRGLI